MPTQIGSPQPGDQAGAKVGFGSKGWALRQEAIFRAEALAMSRLSGDLRQGKPNGDGAVDAGLARR